MGIVLCSYHTKLVGMRIFCHSPSLCDYHTALVGIRLGWHGAILCGHHALLAGLSLSRQGAILCGQHATQGFIRWGDGGNPPSPHHLGLRPYGPITCHLNQFLPPHPMYTPHMLKIFCALCAQLIYISLNLEKNSLKVILI